MAFSNYLSKMRGGGESPPRVGPKEIVWSVLGSFTGIGGCCYLSAAYFEPRDLTLIIASFGASAVLIYGAVKSPLAQPRNLVGGHLISAIIGVACYHSFGGLWFSAALARIVRHCRDALHRDPPSPGLRHRPARGNGQRADP